MNSGGTQPHIYMDPFAPKLPSPPGCHTTLSRGPCVVQQVFVGYLFKIQQCVCVHPKLPKYPFSSFLPPGNHVHSLKSQGFFYPIVCSCSDFSLSRRPQLICRALLGHWEQHRERRGVPPVWRASPSCGWGPEVRVHTHKRKRSQIPGTKDTDFPNPHTVRHVGS